MSVTVHISAPLRRFTSGESEVEMTANNVLDCIDELEARFPGIRGNILNEHSQRHKFVNIYLNGDDVRSLQGLSTTIRPGDEISIVPAIAGG
ncbi:MAG: MoaD family protein [Chloroflexota bacterium]|nr:MoaD family protein [Chloroflexota bacterium]